MPSRHSHRPDPVFRNVERWDDGYDAGAIPAPIPPYPLNRQQTGPSSKTAKYNPKFSANDRDMRPRMPPPEHSYESARPPRTRQQSPSPVRRSYHHRKDEDYTHRDREGRSHPTSRQARPRQSSLQDTKTIPAKVGRGRVTPSPSPPPTTRRSHRDRDRHDRGRDRPRSHSPPPRRRDSPVPPRRVKTTHNNPISSTKHSSRDKGAAVGTSARPALTRSKTTAAALGRNATEILTHPRFQKAAAAALQAGGMAALRQWKTPGPWAGQKGASIATAALGAAAMDAFAKGEAGGATSGAASHSKGDGGGKKSGGVGSALGGLLIEQLSKRSGGERGRR